MERPDPSPLQKRVVTPPQPDVPTPATAFTTVELAEDEEVQWEWTYKDGHSVITGYRIVAREN